MEATPKPPGRSPATIDDVVVFTKAKSGDARSRQESIRRVLGYAIPLVEAALCVILAVSGRLTILFAFGALFAVQQVILTHQVRKLTNPISEDLDSQARVSSILKQLCIAASCPIPEVTLRQTSIPAGVLPKRGQALLLLSTDFVQRANDDELRAVIAHEVAHLMSNDVAIARRRSQILILGTYVLWAALFYTVGRENWIYVFIYVVFLTPFLRLVALPLGFLYRRRETKADLAGAGLTADPDAMIHGLELVYSIVAESRQKIYEGRWMKWALFPFSMRPTTHPKLEDRIVRLHALTPTNSDTR